MFIPEEGTIQYVDAMCIPKSTQNKEAAEMFINYMCEVDVALQNALFIRYTSPLPAVRELLPPELRDSELMYPDKAIIERSEYMSVLSDDLNSAMDMAWSEMKSFNENGNEWLVPVFLLLALALTIFNVWRRRARKRRRELY